MPDVARSSSIVSARFHSPSKAHVALNRVGICRVGLRPALVRNNNVIYRELVNQDKAGEDAACCYAGEDADFYSAGEDARATLGLHPNRLLFNPLQ